MWLGARMRIPRPSRAVLYESPTYLALLARIAANPRRLREARGWTQEECAGRCGQLAPALLRRIEAGVGRGKGNVTTLTLARLCDGLELDGDEFLRTAPPLPKRRPGRPRTPTD